jgi:hypothetical protein
MSNPRVNVNPRNEYDFEVVLKSGASGYTHPGYSFADLNYDMYDEDCIDRITTLSIYYDPTFIQQNDLEILNDGKIHQTPVGKLIADYNLYEYIKKTYGENNRHE